MHVLLPHETNCRHLWYKGGLHILLSCSHIRGPPLRLICLASKLSLSESTQPCHRCLSFLHSDTDGRQERIFVIQTAHFPIRSAAQTLRNPGISLQAALVVAGWLPTACQSKPLSILYSCLKCVIIASYANWPISLCKDCRAGSAGISDELPSTSRLSFRRFI